MGETWYEARIRILEGTLARRTLERDVARDALNRWEVNAKDVGWNPKESTPAGWLRRIARDNIEIPGYIKTIRDLSESVDRLSKQVEDLSQPRYVYSNWVPLGARKRLTDKPDHGTMVF